MLITVNPVSAAGRTRKAWPKMERLLRERGASFDWRFTERPGHATEMAREALKQRYDVIVAVGGDRTLNEVVNGFFEDDRLINPQAHLGLIPCGTGSDFRRSVGVPRDPRGAIERLLSGRVMPVDLGKVRFRGRSGHEETRYFINIADLGLGGETAERVNAVPKFLGGLLSFFIGAVVTILLYRNKQVEVILDDREVIRGRVNTVVVANGRYFAGGMFIAPNAHPDSGLFNVILIGDLGRFELIYNLLRVYRGTHLRNPKIKEAVARTVYVRSQERMVLEMDGEVPGFAEAEFSVVPGAVLVRC